MLYDILKPIIRLALRAYFHKINVIGQENLLDSGPAIYISNHPNAFIDPLILVILMKRKLHFIAGAEWFGNGLKGWIFRKQFNMIPVVRPWLKTENVKDTDNVDMFLECYKKLMEGVSIVIYPEGSTMTVQWIRDLKTGAARIKLGAEAYSEGKINVSVIPVGLNYNRGHRFQSRLTVNIGKPIDFSDIYTTPDPENKEVVRAMTELMQEKLKDKILHIEKPDLKPVIRNVVDMLDSTLKDEYTVSAREIEKEFILKKGIVRAIDFFAENDPDSVSSFDKKIDQYLKRLEELDLKDRHLDSLRRHNKFFLIVKLAVGFPFFLAGIIFNGIPYMLTYRYFRSVWLPKMLSHNKQGQLNPNFVGSMAFAFSLLIFLVWYIVVISVSSIITGIWWFGILMFCAGYFSGRVSLNYLKWLKAFSNHLRYTKIYRKSTEKVNQLAEERKTIIEQLLKYRDKYLDKNRNISDIAN